MTFIALSSKKTLHHPNDFSHIVVASNDYSPFELNQFAQFSRTVGDNAVNQQKIIRDAYITFCNFYSQSAYDVNATWPMYSLPNFELHASNIVKIQGTELLLIMQRIKDEDATDALEYVNNHYENWTIEGHLTRYGNLDRLNPVDYHPYFTLLTPEGRIPDPINRSVHYGMWQFSPRTYTADVPSIVILPLDVRLSYSYKNSF
jgi:hypothetical protein